MDYRFAYLIGILILAVFWIFLFIKRKDLRRQQLIMSLLSAPLAPISQILWFYNDYWRPEYFYSIKLFGIPLGFEEILFAFFIGGIGSVVYEILFSKRARSTKKRPSKYVTVLLLFITFLMFLLLKILAINTIWASSLSLITLSTAVILLNKTLLKDAIFSGLYMLLLTIIMYTALILFFPNIITQFWLSSGLSGNFLFNIPIEELIWFCAWGMFSGVIYEFAAGVTKYTRFVKK